MTLEYNVMKRKWLKEAGRAQKSKEERISPIYDVLMTSLSKHPHVFKAVNFKTGWDFEIFSKRIMNSLD